MAIDPLGCSFLICLPLPYVDEKRQGWAFVSDDLKHSSREGTTVTYLQGAANFRSPYICFFKTVVCWQWHRRCSRDMVWRGSENNDTNMLPKTCLFVFYCFVPLQPKLWWIFIKANGQVLTSTLAKCSSWVGSSHGNPQQTFFFVCLCQRVIER